MQRKKYIQHGLPTSHTAEIQIFTNSMDKERRLRTHIANTYTTEHSLVNNVALEHNYLEQSVGRTPPNDGRAALYADQIFRMWNIVWITFEKLCMPHSTTDHNI